MFELIPLDVFTDILREHLPVLDGQYIDDRAPALLRDLCSRFDEVYNTRFVVIDNETGEPISKKAVLRTRQAADEFCRIAGEDKHSVGVLLVTD